MDCPKCGKEMKAGFLQTGGIIAFNERRHMVSLNPKDPEDVMIFKKAFASADFPGFICKECGLVIFDYNSPETRM